MLSVRGIYTGTEIKPLEDIRMRPNVRVIITFLEDEQAPVQVKRRVRNISTGSQNRTKVFLEKCGGWEDTRSPEEIIADIYASRTRSDRGSHLFQENDA